MEGMNKTGVVSVRKVARLPVSGRFILLALILSQLLTLTASAQEDAAPNFEVQGVDGPELANVQAFLGYELLEHYAISLAMEEGLLALEPLH